MPDNETAAPPRAPRGTVPPERSTARTLPAWMKGVGPLVLLALLVMTFLRFGPVGVFRKSFPPVEELSVERIVLPRPGEIPSSANVPTKRPLARGVSVATATSPPKVSPVAVSSVTTTGSPSTHGYGMVRVRRSSRPSVRPPSSECAHAASSTSTCAMVTGSGPLLMTRTRIYAGVIPVFLGLLWLPFLRTLRRRWIDFFLSLTVGLLVFLGVDAIAEALEFAGRVPGPYQGLGLVLLGVVGTPLLLGALGRRGSTTGGPASPFAVATLVAAGIGLHNLGEGLLIGSAYATGEIALGTFLVVGFLIHNTTEGLGIVAPLARERPTLGRLLLLGALAGVPTVLGAWIGGFTYSPFWTTLFFAVGVGAIIQVVYVLWRMLSARGGGSLLQPLNVAGVFVGMLVMYATGLLVPA